MTEKYEHFTDSIKLIKAIHVYGAVCFYVFGIVYLFYLNSMYLFSCNFIAGTMCLVNLYAYNIFNKKFYIHSFLAIVYVGLINISVHIGVDHFPMIFWGMSVPIAAAFISEVMGTLVWGGLGMMFFFIVTIFRENGVHLALINTTDSSDFVLTLLSYTGLLLFFIYSIMIQKYKLKRSFHLLNKKQDEVITLRGFLPICASCKNIRDDKGYWNQIESYIRDHSEVEFTHSVCPDCIKKLYPDIVDENGSFKK